MLIRLVAVFSLMIQSCSNLLQTTTLTNQQQIIQQESARIITVEASGNDLQYAMLSKKNDWCIEGHAGTTAGGSAAFAISGKWGVGVKYAQANKYFSETHWTNARLKITQQYLDGSSTTHYENRNLSVNTETDVVQDNIEISGLLFYAKPPAFRSEFRFGYAAGKLVNSSFTYIEYAGSFKKMDSRYFHQAFAQGTIGFVTRRTEGAMTTRFSAYDFYNQQQTSDLPIATQEFSQLAATLECAFRLAYGIRNLRLFFQYGTGLSIADADINWDFKDFEVGILLRFGEKKPSK